MATQQDRVGIEFISVLGLNPIAFVDVAADLGCRHIGIALEPIATCATIESQWSLRHDGGLRRDFAAALRERHVSISVGEGFIALPHRDIGEVESDLDLMAELGVTRVNMLSADADTERAIAQCAKFADLAAARGMTALLEFLPGMPTAHDLRSALAIVEHVNKPTFKLLLDTMHLFRSGSTVADVAALDPALIGYVQICDVPLVSKHASYAEEAKFDRLPPGEGELPLRDLIQVLPKDVMLGLELPMKAKAEAGIDARDRLRAAVEMTLDL